MKSRINVLFIAIDTLRADHMSCYGYDKLTTPYIDKNLVNTGVLFENCIAPGIPTHPGYTTMHTGMHPLTHEIVCHCGKVILKNEVKILSQILRSNGYTTAAIDNLVMNAPWFVRGYDYYIFSGGITVISKGIKISGEIVTKKAISFLKAWKEGIFGDNHPFFLFVHYWDPHTPYLPPEDYIKMFYRGKRRPLKELLMQTKWGRHIYKMWLKQIIEDKGIDDKNYVDASYDAEVYYSDRCVEKLIEYLKEINEFDNTLIILTADHGEGLGENNVYYDHHGLYEWDIHVPLIMRLPSLLPEGKRVSELVTHEDIVPTVLDLLNIKLNYKFDGRSLLPIIIGEEKGREFVICVENTRMSKRAIRTKGWKLIQTLKPDIYGRPAGYLELYNLQKGEDTNLADEHKDIAKELLYKMEVWYREKLNGKADPLMIQEISLPI